MLFNILQLTFVRWQMTKAGTSPALVQLVKLTPHRAKIASMSSATMLVILIAGFTAGPAVSL